MLQHCSGFCGRGRIIDLGQLFISLAVGTLAGLKDCIQPFLFSANKVNLFKEIFFKCRNPLFFRFYQALSLIKFFFPFIQGSQNIPRFLHVVFFLIDPGRENTFGGSLRNGLLLRNGRGGGGWGGGGIQILQDISKSHNPDDKKNENNNLQ